MCSSCHIQTPIFNRRQECSLLKFYLVISFHIQICEHFYAEVPQTSEMLSFWNREGPTTKIKSLLAECTQGSVCFCPFVNFFVLCLHPPAERLPQFQSQLSQYCRLVILHCLLIIWIWSIFMLLHQAKAVQFCH